MGSQMRKAKIVNEFLQLTANDKLSPNKYILCPVMSGRKEAYCITDCAFFSIEKVNVDDMFKGFYACCSYAGLYQIAELEDYEDEG